MSDNEDKDFSDEFSPENDNVPSEFNPYEDYLDGELNSNIQNKSDEKVIDSKNSVTEDDKKFTTENDIDIPNFLKNNSVAEEDFKSSVKNNTSSEDEFKPSFENDDSHSVQEESFSSATTQEDEDDDYERRNPESENAPLGGNTEDVEKETESFSKKMSAAEADSKKPHGAKPKVLNKKFLLSTIVIVIGLIFIVTFLMPAGGFKKDNGKGKPVATIRQGTDYASIANRPPVTNTATTNSEKEEPKTEKEEVVIPPVVPKKEKQPYTQGNINYNSGSSVGSSSSLNIPDTRNDSLQGKSISGIKGLTPSQNKYQTNYEQTMAKNTASNIRANNTLPSKEEYVNNILGAYSQAYGNATAGNNSYAVQNDQSGKNSFYNKGRDAANVGQGEYLNLNTLWQGTIFEATLTSELNTDLPGEITARIAKNIYSSQDGRYLLIPQNSILYGTYNSSISYSQSRVQVAWHTLVRPDGYQIQLGSMNATDAKGASGLKGFVNDHPLAYLKAIGLMSVFSIVNSEFQSSMGKTDNEYVQNILANSQEVTVELADKLIDRAMNVQPTIKIKAGTKINIVANQNLTLPPCEDIPVTQAYKRKR